MNKGYVRIKHGANYYFVCDDEFWNQTAADVFCHSLGMEPCSGLPDVSPLMEWDPNELFAIMTQVRCSAEDKNLLECDHRFGLAACPDNRFATANCMAPVKVTPKVTLNPISPKQNGDKNTEKPDVVIFIALMISFLFLINFVIAVASLRNKCRGGATRVPTSQQLVPSYSFIMREDQIVREAPPPPDYNIVVKHTIISLDSSEEPLSPSYSTVLREDQLARDGPPTETPLTRDGSSVDIDLTGDRPSSGDQPDVTNRPSSGDQPDVTNRPSSGDQPDVTNIHSSAHHHRATDLQSPTEDHTAMDIPPSSGDHPARVLPSSEELSARDLPSTEEQHVESPTSDDQITTCQIS
ncbi:uncharacterized protein [Amphiura filiformis]|uniref:uncharacterized protein n=1 Tax=Amphiura filiformis TaxID=82378 RepID=UPI003B216C7E